jgi:hypothetical protein
MSLNLTLPPAPPISYPLTGDEYALVVAALRLLEDDLHDGDDECRAIAAEAVALRARLRAIRARGPVLAVVVPIRAESAR